MRLLYMGRRERIALAILSLLGMTGLFLYAISQPPRESQPPRARYIAQQSQPSAKLSDTTYKDKAYVGPPSYLRAGASQKFRERVVLDLNTVDSATLLRVPGIGQGFAKRILALREKLGGYYTVLQLQEVYGMDEDRFLALRPWFRIKTPPRRYRLDSLRVGELPRHPYLSWEQQRALNRLISRHGRLRRWSQLMREPSFTRDDSIRLSPYLVEIDTLAKK
ncbi:MAG: helix-hairpin-helix domain-containing protein [Porphyromonas sp.]|nr:helix-hairpin-helix domain-containing protein [Porphyromonas sp.]